MRVDASGTCAGLLLLFGRVTACDSGDVQASSGVTEPLQISSGQFFAGPLPGLSPDAGPSDGGTPSTLAVTNVNYQSLLIVPGTGSKSLGGVVSSDTSAVGVRFADLGTGYWVVPVQGLDSQMPGRDFGFTAGFNASDPPGPHDLLFVALDGSGNGGLQYALPMCVESRVPDNGHACDPSKPVPTAVFTLRWDTNFDLDLHVVTPDGQDVNPKMDPDVGDAGLPTAKTARIDRDSIGNCVVDGWHEEDLVFPEYPETGYYEVYVNPFSACSQQSVRFEFAIYEAGSDGNLHATFSQSGEILATQQTGGGSTGLFVAEKVFE